MVNREVQYKENFKVSQKLAPSFTFGAHLRLTGDGFVLEPSTFANFTLFPRTTSLHNRSIQTGQGLHAVSDGDVNKFDVPAQKS